MYDCELFQEIRRKGVNQATSSEFRFAKTHMEQCNACYSEVRTSALDILEKVFKKEGIVEAVKVLDRAMAKTNQRVEYELLKDQILPDTELPPFGK